jgi:hypothetical protein
LALIIKDYWDPNNQAKLGFQKIYFDNFYNWDLRVAQWTDFLESLGDKK